MSSASQTVPSSGRVLFFLVLTTFLWGGSFLFTKIGVREVPPQFFVFFRFVLASILMGIICLPRLRNLGLVTVRRGVIVGVALGITNLTFVFGINGTSISRAGVINNLFILFIPLVTRIVWKERVDRLNMAGIFIASAGIALLAGAGGAGLSKGDLVSTLCAFFIAIHIITVSKVLKDEDVWLVSFVQFCVVALLSGTVVMFTSSHDFTLSRASVFSIIYCAIFPTVVCFTIQNMYQRYVTPTQAGLIYTLDPVWSLMAGFIVLGERLSLLEWLGCSLIFFAVLFPLSYRFVVERRLMSRYINYPAG